MVFFLVGHCIDHVYYSVLKRLGTAHYQWNSIHVVYRARNVLHEFGLFETFDIIQFIGQVEASTFPSWAFCILAVPGERNLIIRVFQGMGKSIPTHRGIFFSSWPIGSCYLMMLSGSTLTYFSVINPVIFLSSVIKNSLSNLCLHFCPFFSNLNKGKKWYPTKIYSRQWYPPTLIISLIVVPPASLLTVINQRKNMTELRH